MNRTQALRGAEERIGASLLLRPDQPLAGMAIPSPQIHPSALPPNEAGTRAVRAVTVAVPPGADVFALFHAHWQQAGYQPQSWSTADGQVLAARDIPGFGFVLQQRAGQVELCVFSPPLDTGAGPLFWGGLGLGLAIGLIGPCASSMVFTPGSDDRLGFLAFVPCVLLLGGGLLIPAQTRRFGLGLMTGTAITGIVTAGICASMFL